MVTVPRTPTHNYKANYDRAAAISTGATRAQLGSSSRMEGERK